MGVEEFDSSTFESRLDASNINSGVTTLCVLNQTESSWIRTCEGLTNIEEAVRSTCFLESSCNQNCIGSDSSKPKVQPGVVYMALLGIRNGRFWCQSKPQLIKQLTSGDDLEGRYCV